MRPILILKEIMMIIIAEEIIRGNITIIRINIIIMKGMISKEIKEGAPPEAKIVAIIKAIITQIATGKIPPIRIMIIIIMRIMTTKKLIIKENIMTMMKVMIKDIKKAIRNMIIIIMKPKIISQITLRKMKVDIMIIINIIIEIENMEIIIIMIPLIIKEVTVSKAKEIIRILKTLKEMIIIIIRKKTKDIGLLKKRKILQIKIIPMLINLKSQVILIILILMNLSSVRQISNRRKLKFLNFLSQ